MQFKMCPWLSIDSRRTMSLLLNNHFRQHKLALDHRNFKWVIENEFMLRLSLICKNIEIQSLFHRHVKFLPHRKKLQLWLLGIHLAPKQVLCFPRSPKNIIIDPSIEWHIRYGSYCMGHIKWVPNLVAPEYPSLTPIFFKNLCISSTVIISPNKSKTVIPILLEAITWPENSVW